MNLSETIKEKLKEKNIKISELSRITKISVVSLRKYIEGIRYPNVNNLMKVCKALDIDYGKAYDEFYRNKRG